MPASRDDRIEQYYCSESARNLAEWLVDAEDEIEAWKFRVERLKAEKEKQ